MGREEFEVAVSSAVLAKRRSGHKWKPLERFFAALGYRGTGAIVEDPHQLRNRISQLFAVRAHPGYENKGPSEHTVFVFGDHDLDEILPIIIGRWNANAISVLVVKYQRATINAHSDSKQVKIRVNPVLLLTAREDEFLVRRYKEWYPGLVLVRIAGDSI